MQQAISWLDETRAFDPAVDVDAWSLAFPPRWGVALLADEQNRPVQLLCVKNVRYCVRRRLGIEQEDASRSRRIDYRQVVRHVSWRRVDSAFEADWIYYEIARQVFPETYQGMVGFRPAWFVHVNPETPFPRYAKTIELTSRPGVFIGPLEDKHAAARLIELVEDAFDLCRYYHILVQSPLGRACAYKEMGKCPAPCDGSISIEQYHRLIAWSVEALIDPSEQIREHSRRMQQAAGELRFEAAGKIKAYIEQLSEIRKGAFRHARQLKDFAFVCLQRGARDGSAVIFLITPGCISALACILGPIERPAEIMRAILLAIDVQSHVPFEPAGAERIGIVAHHLFAPKQTQGVFLPLANLSEQGLQRGYRDLIKQKIAPDNEGEGVTKELQAME